MPHLAAPPQPSLPRKVLSPRRAVLACAAVAALALLVTQTTEDPRRRRAYLMGSIVGETGEYMEASASAPLADSSYTPPPYEAPLPSLLETELSPRTTAASSVFLAPSPSPANNFYDDSMEEPEHHDIKPIPSGLPVRSSDLVGENGMNGKSVLPERPEAPLWSTAADKELIYAKKEIANAPLVTDDPDLYAPLFRNVSIFKRSYEMMERLLKVFIYHDGAKPIFHSPQLKGIYASEGWFMKLMEGNQNFVVRDPNRAHLFYLPYSSRQLEHNLYVPGSNTIEPLSIFLRNYIDTISAKYPYWNRTKGADHFFVACHDWGPYTTKLHNDLRKNTIKALCNADLSEGIFIRGKDVSLPETFLRSPRRPLRNIGGRPVAQRTILAFFAGQMHGRVRPVLLRHWGGKDADMRIYSRLPHKITRRRNYVQHMKSSKYCICPMGYEVNSPRIVEAIYYECVPVIIADNFVLPFDDALNWSSFSVVVPERDIPKLKDILLAIPESQYITMQSNVKRVQKHFLWHANPVKYDIFHMILHSVWFSRLNQIQIE